MGKFAYKFEKFMKIEKQNYNDIMLNSIKVEKIINQTLSNKNIIQILHVFFKIFNFKLNTVYYVQFYRY